MKLSDLFFSPTPSPITTTTQKQQPHEGWHAALNWEGTEKVFFGFFCETCHMRCTTPLLKDIGRAYKTVVRHCGREETVTIAELMAANLPTVRTEPSHHKGVTAVGDTQMMQVGDFGDGDDGIKYDGVNAGPEGSDPAEGRNFF